MRYDGDFDIIAIMKAITCTNDVNRKNNDIFDGAWGSFIVP